MTPITFDALSPTDRRLVRRIRVLIDRGVGSRPERHRWPRDEREAAELEEIATQVLQEMENDLGAMDGGARRRLFDLALFGAHPRPEATLPHEWKTNTLSTWVGHRSIEEILAYFVLDRNIWMDRAILLDALEELAPGISARIRAWIPDFEEIVAAIDDHSLRTLIHEFGCSRWGCALSGLPEAILERVYRNVSPRVARILRDDVELGRRPSPHRREQIVRLALRLASIGSIRLPQALFPT